MRALRINFEASGPVFDFSSPLVDFDTTVQNALVTLGTDAGSDPIFPDRGTALLLSATSGMMVNQVYANHAGNFAALDVLAFIQETELQANPYKMQNFTLVSTSLTNDNVIFTAQATGVNGEIRGITASM